MQIADRAKIEALHEEKTELNANLITILNQLKPH